MGGTLKGGTALDGHQWAAAFGSTRLLPMRVERNAKTNLPTEKKTLPLPVLFSFNVIGNIGLLENSPAGLAFAFCDSSISSWTF